MSLRIVSQEHLLNYSLAETVQIMILFFKLRNLNKLKVF